ncbi:MAG: hypothetical protein A3F75_08485 [Betaproteobacteria bacterium RIFCSPLOWO2_12_FULL_64_23]|nr:MAG: hypothetical protein A3F75_08485 [Betaproteobacteria bacterium RIFCSPLOWO2_12_FULL_64_23]
MRHTTFKIVLAGAALLIATTAFAADSPVKAVRMVTPFSPGGSVDLVACVLSATSRPTHFGTHADAICQSC